MFFLWIIGIVVVYVVLALLLERSRADQMPFDGRSGMTSPHAHNGLNRPLDVVTGYVASSPSGIDTSQNP